MPNSDYSIDGERVRRVVAYSLLVLVALNLVFVGPAVAEEDSEEEYQSIICSVGMFRNTMNGIIQLIVSAFSPIAITGILGDWLVGSLPIGKKRRKKFKEWRGRILISTFGMYILMPLGVEFARRNGFPLASCIDYIPW